ncbi:MATE efflux family protein, partial [Stipitochalara longipes BDJ]
ELGILLASSFPLVCASILQTSLVGITLLFVGHLGKQELAAVSVACLTARVTGWSVFEGLASALDTLCPQAYGAGLKSAVGLHTQRMALLLLCMSVPVGLSWYYSHGFLRLLVSDDEVCNLARDFLRILSLGCPGFAFFECGKRLLQAQGHFSAGLYTLLICIPFHACLTWYLVSYLETGLWGAAISISVTRSMLPLGLTFYSWLFTDRECWRTIDAKIFKNWGPMAKLAVPDCLMMVADSIGFEVLTLLAGLNGTAELCAQSLLCLLVSTTYQVPLSLSIAASTRIAELMGKGSASGAKYAAKCAMLLAIGVGILNVVLIPYFRHGIPYLFTNDQEVADLMLGVLPLIGIFQLIDAVLGVLNGIIRGLGKQYIGAWIQMICFYGIGIPCSIGAAFGFGWHLIGLWAGISLALILIVSLECVYLSFVDWGSFLKDAEERNA